MIMLRTSETTILCTRNSKLEQFKISVLMRQFKQSRRSTKFELNSCATSMVLHADALVRDSGFKSLNLKRPVFSFDGQRRNVNGNRNQSSPAQRVRVNRHTITTW